MLYEVITVDKVLTNNAHQVVTNHLDVALNRILTDIGVDSGKTLGNSTRTLERRFVYEHDFHISRSPLLDLESSSYNFV